MTTTLTYLGHACFFFETDRAAVLVDPWLTPKGAFLGAWRQLPPNDHVLPWVLEKMKAKPVLVYLTHEHEDHYDEETLKTLLPRAAGLCIPDYESDFLRRLIDKNLKIKPRLVAEDAPQDFHDITFKIFIDESGINRDSAIFLKGPGLSFLDVNDCKIYDRAAWLRERCGDIDLLSVQFSGANMHPICYEMTEDQYRQVSRQKRIRKFVAVRNFINDLKPRYYLPSAGPAVFSLPEHEKLNFEAENIFPKWQDFQAYLESKNVETSFIPLDVKGSVISKGGEIRFDGIAQKISDDDVRKYIAYYRAADAALPAQSPPPTAEVIAFLEREMNSKIAVLRANPKARFGSPLYIEIKDTGALYCIHPDRLALEKADKAAVAAPYYLHTASLSALAKLMRSGKGWGTYFLSFQFRGARVPDVFDSVLGTFFVANDAEELDFGLRKLVEFRESDEYITLCAPDGVSTVTCKRFCPHQGADLKYAKFDGRYVTCPRHQWKFDCENGGVADNSADTIDATPGRREKLA